MPLWSDRLGLERPRAKSLIVTVYGDSLLPRGGQCWLSELIELLEPMGVNERMTRTAVFRLVQDGLLEAERVGRRSRYSLTPKGRSTFDSAQARIYASAPPETTESWTLILLPKTMEAGVRETVAKALSWIGYASLGENTLGAPHPSAPAEAILSDLAVTDQCMVFEATPRTPDRLPEMIRESWALDTLAAEYETFRKAFSRLDAQLPGTDQDAFELRSLLIHAYRRILLRDPALPEAQLPTDWPGIGARNLTAGLYRALTPRVDRFLSSTLSDAPEPSQESARFP